MGNRFKIVLDFNEEDGGFTVTVPALPGCVTEGDTIEEALTNAKEVIKGYLKALEIQGRPISPTQLTEIQSALSSFDTYKSPE
jgi:predicted RNase H-like HicB family nuclease